MTRQMNPRVTNGNLMSMSPGGSFDRVLLSFPLLHSSNLIDGFDFAGHIG